MLEGPFPPATADVQLARASSLTHQHLLAVVNTRLAAIAPTKRVITICDVGCGNGVFLSYLASGLRLLWPRNEFHFYGIDVSDSGVQAEGFFASTIRTLAAAHPEVDWTSRLHLIRSTERWPFDDGAIDVITSNQVLEHVRDHAHFMAESYRVLATGGVGTHLFPLRHYIWEGHLHIPLVHKIHQHDLVRKYIKAMSYIGLGVYKGHRDQFGHSRDFFAEEHADYMTFMTNYKSAREMLAYCKAAGLRSTYAHTWEFYEALLRKRLGLKPRHGYKERGFMFSLLSYLFCRYLSSVTLTTEKHQLYSR
ncbi:MAG: class I SAM-dependent methyltransferase [Sphingomonas sp.]|uniref:class I SAM-dependent methyltransferase n=1 Tax=Sphingomonas sp. TaxID=28214 RepID=UPI001B2A0085|nr:class I SAM-dependent methyltransferase [Sphingomonas sp.]MBO9624355.1 class I SAM-dependent methyltransferase [Sphingomonas sp.]